MRGHFQKQRTPLQHAWPLLAVSAIQSQRVHSCNVIGPKTTLREAIAECEHVPTHCAPTKERPERINGSVNGVSIGLATRWSRVSTEYKLRNSSLHESFHPPVNIGYFPQNVLLKHHEIKCTHIWNSNWLCQLKMHLLSEVKKSLKRVHAKCPYSPFLFPFLFSLYKLSHNEVFLQHCSSSNLINKRISINRVRRTLNFVWESEFHIYGLWRSHSRMLNSGQTCMTDFYQQTTEFYEDRGKPLMTA
jgi:hypothetical protein